MHRVLLILFLAAVAVVGPLSSPALAHAIILQATPAPNADIAGPDAAVELRFNSRIDARRSRLVVAGSAGERPLEIQEGGSPDRLNAQLKGLTPGDYKLKWQVLAIDGHITRGEIPFRVRSH
jgi:methionine-rich copper-binding protein CopC